jgi:hypothetical protein
MDEFPHIYGTGRTGLAWKLVVWQALMTQGTRSHYAGLGSCAGFDRLRPKGTKTAFPIT